MKTGTVMSPYPAHHPIETAGLRLSTEELDKLQEIHELINLMFRELPMRAQPINDPYAMSALPAVPYTHSYFSWGVSPYPGHPGF